MIMQENRAFDQYFGRIPGRVVCAQGGHPSWAWTALGAKLGLEVQIGEGVTEERVT
jgi:hypothetical protein